MNKTSQFLDTIAENDMSESIGGKHEKEHDAGVSAYKNIGLLRSSRVELVVAGILIIVGISVRLFRYFQMWPLRIDEIRLAANVSERSFLGLTQMLDYNQSAPMGFLWLQKLALNFIGFDEIGLRFLPLLASIATLILLFVVGQRILQSTGTLFCLMLAAFSWYLILWSFDVKQFGLESLVTLSILAVSLPLRHVRNNRDLIVLASVGVVSLLLSFSALFVLAAVGITLFANALISQDMKWTRKVSLVGCLWVGVFVFIYWLNLRHSVGRTHVVSFFLQAFMPMPPKTPSDFLWFYNAFYGLFSSIGLPAIILLTLLFFLGIQRLYSSDIQLLSFLTLPIVIAAIASGFQMYPFEGRLLIFAAPLTCLLIGAGFQHLYNCLVREKIFVAMIIVALVATSQLKSIAFEPVWWGGRYDVVPALDYVTQNGLPGDIILVSRALAIPYLFYSDLREVPNTTHYIDLPVKIGDPIPISTDLKESININSRVWVFIPHSHVVGNGKSVDVRVPTLAALNAMGEQIVHFSSANVLIALCDIKSNETPSEPSSSPLLLRNSERN